MKKKNNTRYIALVVVLIIVVIGVYKYLEMQKYESTDDAQLEGDINTVLPKVSGYVKSIRFEENQLVKKGDTLVKLDDADLKVKLEQAMTALDNAKAAAGVTKANVSVAAAALETAKSSVETAKIHLWKVTQDFNRYEKLLADKSVTQQQYDAIKADKETAESQLNTVQKQHEAENVQYEASRQQINVSEAAIKQRQADVDFAALQLSYADIIAPSTGVISKKSIQLGELVQVAQPLCAIVLSTKLWVEANFKETQLTKMRLGQDVDIEVDAFKDMGLKGTVETFSGATGARFSLLPPDNATGNFVKVVQRVPVRIKLNMTKEQLALLRPGLSVNVKVFVK